MHLVAYIELVGDTEGDASSAACLMTTLADFLGIAV